VIFTRNSTTTPEQKNITKSQLAELAWVSGLHHATQMNDEHGKKTFSGVMQTDSKLSSTNYTFRLAVALTLYNFHYTVARMT
jgi:hypothetical protein